MATGRFYFWVNTVFKYLFIQIENVQFISHKFLRYDFFKYDIFIFFNSFMILFM